MNFQVLWEASPYIQIHLATAVAAIILTMFILLGKKGSATHKILGRLWVVSMLVTAFVSFFIHEVRPPDRFSLIHLLSLFTIFSLSDGWIAARKHNIRRHKTAMLAVVFGGLFVAGSLTLIPGRLLHTVIFGW